MMSSADWGGLPLLPLRCVLEHLSTEDALAATSVCRHWRSALLLYEGHKETLKLRVTELDRSMFLTRIFRKYTRRLHVHINCSDLQLELEEFLNYILPQFFDTQELNEVVFIGPNYLKQTYLSPIVKLKRKIIEGLLYKHLHCIQKLTFMGCEMSTMNTVEKENYVHKRYESYTRPLSFNSVTSPMDAVLSRCSVGLMVFSTLQHITVDYWSISTEALETLSHLTLFKHLTLNITRRRKMSLAPIDWERLGAFYPNGLEVSVNIIAIPIRKFDDVIDKVLVSGLNLTSLKVMYCKTFHDPLLRHLASLFKNTLKELVWVDCPSECPETRPKGGDEEDYDACNVNPLILICWQCAQLRRLVIHGYWVWQYDVVGFVRLRKTLRHLEISSVQGTFGRRVARAQPSAAHVLVGDAPQPLDHHFVHQVNEYTSYRWRPTAWHRLHPGLRAHATPDQRTAYILHEARRPLGVT
ncbi:unnamed protein product, partial [Iphiclides podalirius]